MTRNRTPDHEVEELARLLEDGATETSDEELGELIHLAQGLRDAPTAVPSAAFRERLRGQLLTESAAMLPVAAASRETTAIGFRQRFAHWRRSVSLALASALSATAIGGAGVAVASQRSLPGDALYDVKRGIESVRMAVASGDLETGRLHLAFAHERLDEVADGVDDLTPDQLIDTLRTMDDDSALGANELMDVYDGSGDPEVLRELAGFVDDQREGLLAVVDELPVEAVPFAQRSLELVRRIEVQAGGLLLRGCQDCEGGAPVVQLPGEAPARDTGTGSAETTPVGDPAGATSTGGDVEATEEPSDGVVGGDDPADTPTLEVPLAPTLDPTLDPNLEPSLDPSLPIEEVSDTVGDLLFE